MYSSSSHSTVKVKAKEMGLVMFVPCLPLPIPYRRSRRRRRQIAKSSSSRQTVFKSSSNGSQIVVARALRQPPLNRSHYLKSSQVRYGT